MSVREMITGATIMPLTVTALHAKPAASITPLVVTALPPSNSSYIDPSTTPWYKTWWGVGSLVLGGTLAFGTAIALVRR